MGKPKNKVAGTGGEEEARPSGGEEENAPVKQEGNAEEGEVSAPAPVPAPRKRGRPRKVALKVEESIEIQTQQVSDAESKKKKAENPGRNGSAADAHPSSSRKFPHVPLRREGSRRKSEPRRAAD